MAFLLAAVLAITVLLALPAGANGGPTVTAGGPFDYTEQDPATAIGTGITVTNGSFYDGRYIEFAPDSATGSEILSLTTDASADATNGVVSIVGGSVYLGNGTTADIIGSVDTILDGQNGQPLRINFTSDFVNPGFETGDIEGWTALNQRIDLGNSSIAGCPTVDTSTYPGGEGAPPNEDDNVPDEPGFYTSDVVTAGQPPEGQYTLRLESTEIWTQAGFDVVHGPAVYSSPFEVAGGDTIHFDWRAFAGDDAFHVFGYVIDAACNQLEVLDAVGTDATGSTNWATSSTVIPTSGTYRFVFVSGSYDFTGGQLAGASLLIDRVRVFGVNKASDDAVQQIARRLQYANTADNPPTSQTITVTAVNTDGNSDSDQITVNITGVDDEPTLDPVAPETLTNTADGSETFANQTGTLNATDPDDDAISYGVAGGETVSEDIGGVTYTRRLVGTYGTVYVNDSTGAYVYVPDDDAINAHSSGDDSDEFDLTATAAGVTVEQTLTIEIDIDESVPGEPTAITTTPGNAQVALSWTEPSWLGGSPITGYRVEYSADSGTTWNVAVANTGSAATSYTVTGLQNAVETSFRVSAINATGTGDPSDVVLATPRRPEGGGGPAPAPPPGDLSDEASDEVPGRGTVTTDPRGQGPNQQHPVTGTVRTPKGGTVTIEVTPPRSNDSIHGLRAFGRGVDIEAPDATRNVPLLVTLTVHESELPGTSRGRVLVLKDGEPITASCRGGTANPDPCIFARSVEGGDLEVQVLSTEGGRFAFTEPTRACPLSLTVSGRFNDVASTHAGAVDCISTWRPSLGYGDDTYRDEAGMTRGQLASIVASSLEAGGIPLPASPDASFEDLQGSVHAKAIRQLAELRLLNGINEDTFAPNRRLTRAQTAAVLVRIAERLGEVSLPSGQQRRFSDISGSVHRDEILKAAGAGFTNGFGDGTFRPGADVTRGQGATFIVRMLDRMVRTRELNLPL